MSILSFGISTAYGVSKLTQLVLKQEPVKNYAPVYHDMDQIGPNNDGKINAKDVGFDFAFRIVDGPMGDFDPRVFEVDAYTTHSSLYA